MVTWLILSYLKSNAIGKEERWKFIETFNSWLHG